MEYLNRAFPLQPLSKGLTILWKWGCKKISWWFTPFPSEIDIETLALHDFLLTGLTNVWGHDPMHLNQFWSFIECIAIFVSLNALLNHILILFLSTGSTVIDWLVSKNVAHSRSDAVTVASLLIEDDLIKPVGDKSTKARWNIVSTEQFLDDSTALYCFVSLLHCISCNGFMHKHLLLFCSVLLLLLCLSQSKNTSPPSSSQNEAQVSRTLLLENVKLYS